MGIRVSFRFLGFLGFVLAFPLLLTAVGQRSGRKYTPPPATATIKVTVLRSTNNKPIANAAVIFHPVEGDKDKGALELKSDPDGQVTIDVIPVGDTVRLQVIAEGWKTYGEDYKIDTNSKEIVVKMKRPGEQYSLYGDGKGTTSSTTAPKGESNSAKPSEQTPLPQ
ncbi:MAG: hypothetical protein WA510_08565 [Acidobacteriaceae bacterium]